MPARPGTLSLPIKLVVPRLPDSVRVKANLVGASNASVSLPVAMVLAQLPTGAITIAFDELRKACPAQVFANVSSQEQFTLELPLAEILSRVDPALLKRNPHQKRIEVPTAVTDVFGSKGESLPQPKAEPDEEAAPTAEPEPAPASLAGIVSAPAGTASATPPPTEKPSSTPPEKVVMTAEMREQALKAVIAAAQKKPGPVTPAAAARGPAATAAAAEKETFPIAISSVSGGWPELVRREIDQLNQPNANLLVPAARVREALKAGFVAFNWKEIRSWIKPSAPGDPSPATAELLLEFPLPIIAPLFLARGKAVPITAKTFVPENIPDLFGGTGHGTIAASVGKIQEPRFPAPVEKTAAPSAQPAALELPAAAEETPVNLGELFGQPDKQNWYPNEIVRKVVELPGVAGANISLYDGLPVASNWPPGVTNDTVCAFIAQIFGRVTQYTKELKLGEIQSLTFTMDRGPLQIFKAGKLYFAVLGLHGQPLPTPQLLAIVAELTRQHR